MKKFMAWWPLWGLYLCLAALVGPLEAGLFIVKGGAALIGSCILGLILFAAVALSCEAAGEVMFRLRKQSSGGRTPDEGG